MSPPVHTDKVAVALWEAPAISTANTVGRLRVANLAPPAPHQPSSWLKSVSVPLGSAFLVPTEIICKGARAACAPHLLAPGSVQPRGGGPGWEGTPPSRVREGGGGLGETSAAAWKGSWARSLSSGSLGSSRKAT